MLISKNFFNTKVARNIAFLLFFAASIPVLLLSILSNQKISDLVSNYEHKFLVESSQSYALSAFSNLTFARSVFEKSITLDKVFAVENFKTRETDNPMFNSIKILSVNGEQLNGNINTHITPKTLQQILTFKPGKTQILTIPNENGKSAASINFIYVSKNNAIYIAELNSNYIWGNTTDYPADLSVCAYQLSNSIKRKLFCSAEYNSAVVKNTSPVNTGEWELFLAAEFNTDPWLVEIHRLNSITKAHLREYIGTKAYLSVGLLCLLLVGLFTLIQIRRTMVPMEKLVKGAKDIAKGDFAKINVDGSSEFAELANAFNSMSSYIKAQFDTLESFSAIDKEIISTVDVEQVIQLIIDRMQKLKPEATFLIASIEDSLTNEYPCNCKVSGNEALSAIRLSLTSKELQHIKHNYQGVFKECSMSSEYIHERVMAEIGITHLWALPVFWQDEMCAFILVGKKSTLNKQPEIWSEIKDLASRIGIVISAHKREQKLLFEAQYDNLTGLPNRILLHDRLKQAIDHSHRTGMPVWTVFIDLDRFKVVNDSLGHTTGDALLAEIGNRLQSATRETDTVARFGGDEFVLILSGEAGENIQLSILNRIMDSISQPVFIHQQELITTCSVGIAVYPSDGNSPEMLIKNADIAMYRAKEVGRNNYQFFTKNLNKKAAERMQIISLLRKAIENDELTLHYQPKIDLKTNEIAGLEALLRWNNEVLGNVSPAKFIPIAEEAGLISVIGEWVLKTACQQLVVWQKSGLAKILLSINLSSRQLQQQGLIESLKSILVETGMKTEYLELELTESLLMDQSQDTINKLHAIKSLGIQLSVDDFGTGFSNLSYLDTLPLDTLKIDKAFVDTISLNKEKAPIVDTIILLAKNLNLKVVAEGVETVEQVHYLKRRDCDQIQGYYYSKPLPADDIRALLASGKKFASSSMALVAKTRKKI